MDRYKAAYALFDEIFGKKEVKPRWDTYGVEYPPVFDIFDEPAPKEEDPFIPSVTRFPDEDFLSRVYPIEHRDA